MKNQLLLVEDVDAVGRKGDIVSVRPGYARNFLLPQQKAVVATVQTLRMRQRLQEERAAQAEIDRKESEVLAKQIDGRELKIEVKVDPDGRMYGSVGAVDIVKLWEKEGIQIEKRNVPMPHAIKKTGAYEINLSLKEAVLAHFILHVVSDSPMLTPVEKAPEAPKEEIPEEPSEES